MEFPALRGRSILLVEDEPLIGMDIRAALEEAGAHVTATTTVRHALLLIEHDGLAGAIIMRYATAIPHRYALACEPKAPHTSTIAATIG
jgi:CheY-like chemotaxis protein